MDVRREQEEPTQFLWRGRLWQVRGVVGHWVETGPWWQSTGVRAVIGSEEQDAGGVDRGAVATLAGPDLLRERECRARGGGAGSRGRLPPRSRVRVFDLTFSWATGEWRLTGCVD